MRRYVMMTPLTRNPGTLTYRRLTFTQAEEWVREKRFICTIGWKKVTIALHLLFGCSFHKMPCPAQKMFALEPGDEALLVLLEEGPHEEAFYALKIPWILEHARFALLTMVNEAPLLQEPPAVPSSFPIVAPVAPSSMLPQATIATEQQPRTIECADDAVGGEILDSTSAAQDAWFTFPQADSEGEGESSDGDGSWQESDEDEDEEQSSLIPKRIRNRKKHATQRRRGMRWHDDEEVYV